MPGHDIIAVGGSAGSLDPLRELVAGLPTDLPAAVFVAVHQVPYRPSSLPELLSRAGALPARHPADRDPIRPGVVYVAPPDRHLLVGNGHVRVVQGPREHHTRPAVDPLFRSAAATYGPRVIGVVLSGYLDDGTAGLSAIHAEGGLTVVQDSSEASAADMPSNAAREVPAAIRVRAVELGATLARLSREPAAPRVAPVPSSLSWEVAVAAWDLDALVGVDRPGQPSPFGCPDLRGRLVGDPGRRAASIPLPHGARLLAPQPRRPAGGGR